MFPEPLHPAVVHLPIALSVLLPLVGLVGAVVIQRELLPPRAWAVVVLLAILLVGSTEVALETGEHEEERVEVVVAERFIEAHEEAAEQFMAVGVLVLLACSAGLVAGRVGSAARAVSVVLALVLLLAGVRVGRQGGALVYEHGAAAAYHGGSVQTEALYGARAGDERHEVRYGEAEDDDDDDDEDDDD